MRTLRTAGFVGAVVCFAVASATLAVLGAGSAVDERPGVGAALGAVVALGLAAPPLTRRFVANARSAAMSSQEMLRWHADFIREQIVDAGAGLSPKDLGVHIFLRRRRPLVPWRNEFVRFARSAVTSRAPEPSHAAWRENWWTGVADGLIGISAERRARLQVDLMDAEHVSATKEEWDEWYTARDERSLGVPWERGAKGRKWFSTVWAEPVPSSDGRVLGVISLNVEREVADGYERLVRANTPEILKRQARAIGVALTGGPSA